MTDQQHPITPPELGPAEQVMIAVTHIYQEHGGEPPARAVAAAALRAAADQVAPADGSRRTQEIRAELLAIATELENQ